MAGLILRRARAPWSASDGRTIALVLLALVAATAATVPGAHAHTTALRETLKALEYAAAFVAAWSAAGAGGGAGRALGVAAAAVTAGVAIAALHDVAVPQSGLWFEGRAYLRIAGPLEGPNQLASWIGLVLPVVAAEVPGAWAAAAAAAGAGLLATTLSRAGSVQVALALAALAARVRPARRACAAAAAAFVLALAGYTFALHSGAGIAHIGSLAESVDAGGTGSRAILWSAALRMWRAHPVLGVGAGNFETELPAYGAPPRVRTHANSLYLEAFADGGIVLGAATIVAALLPPLLLLRSGSARCALPFAAGAAGLALAVHGLLDDVTFFTKVGQCWWTIAGVAAAAGSSAPSTTPGTRYPRT